MDAGGTRRRARPLSTCRHRTRLQDKLIHFVIEQPTSKQQQSHCNQFIRFITNISLCLLMLFLLHLNRVRGQHSDFQPIRLASAQRHQPFLVPLPAQLRPHPRHYQQADGRHHNFQQRRHHVPSNLSFPPMRRAQDHRASNFMAALNERMQRDQQQRLQQDVREASRQTKSLDHQSHHERHHQPQSLVSDRRASPSSWSPNHAIHDGHQTKFSQLQADNVGAPKREPSSTSEKQPTQAADASNGKLLICYYTSRQAAPYWPKDEREFVMPAERLDLWPADLLDPTQQQPSSVNVGSFNDRYPNYQRPEAKHMHSKYSDQPKVSAAGDRSRQMILVAPRFAPFNRTATVHADSPAPAHERHRSGNGPLTQLFFMSPTGSPPAHQQHNSISSRQDNLPAASTPSSVPDSTGEQLAATSGQPTRSQNNGVLGGELAQSSGFRAGPAGRLNNGESDAANFVQMRRQQQSMDTSLAPAPTSRTFKVPTSSPSSWTTNAARADNELHAVSLPTSPNVMSNNYYYYYNNNNNSPSGPPATTVSFPAGSTVQNGVSLQRAKSLQMAESELSPALQVGVSSAPVAQTSASLSPANAAASSPATAAASLGGSSTNTAAGAFAAQQQQREQLLKIQGSQMGQGAIEEQKATTSLVLNGPSSTQLSIGTTSGATSRPSSPIVLTADDLLIAGRQQQQQQQQKQHESGSLSSALVGSPLSTVFDVFGAASQYLMRFKPSSLISPAAFSSNFNSQTGQLTNLAHQQRQSASGLLASPHHSSKTNSSSLFSGAAASFISFPFSNGLLSTAAGANQLAKSTDSPSAPASERTTNGTSSAAKGGFLSRLALYGSTSSISSNQQQHQQQRREDICGRTIQTPERRIIGGEGAKYGEFPYQVHIKIAKHQCGGALVDRQSIVTAAHCVYHFITRAPVSKLQIVIGAYDIEDEQYQELPPQYFKVSKVKLHPNFRFSASHPDRYDIAILKLDKPVKYTDNVLPVCLPGKDLRFENMVGTVTGFGKTDPSLSNRYGTRLLQKVDVPIIENNECERWHRTRGIDLKIFPEMMCAGYEDGLKDACVGDSGGPLVVKSPIGSNGSFRWTLAGITSAGFGCAQSRQPGIYHRVSHTVDWILENLD